MDLRPSQDSIALERLKVAARAELSPQMAHDVDFRSMFDHVTNRLILELRSTVYAHRVGVDDQTVPFSKEVRFAGGEIQHVPRVWLPHALAAVVAAVAAVLFASLAFALVAVVSAVVAIANRKPARVIFEYDETRTVSGDVKVEARYFNTFPDNTVVYPDTLGGAVKLIQLSPPDVRYFNPNDDLRGERDR